MKKCIITVLVLLVCFSALSSPVNAVSNAITVGDMNRDGVVDIQDAALIRRSLLGLYEVRLMEVRADFDRDGEVTIADAAWIQREAAGFSIPSTCGGEIFTDILVICFESDIPSGEASVGDTVTFTAKASASLDNITYAFYVDDEQVQPRSADNTLVYSFQTSGEHRVKVVAYNYAGISNSRTIWYMVKEN